MVAAFALAIGGGGCKAGPKNFENENDALRREVTTLRDEVARLKAENTDLRARAAQALAALKASDEPGARVIESMPRCAAVEIGARSGPVRGDPNAFEVLIETLDARRRFVQVAGELGVEVTRLGDGGGGAGAAPLMLGSVTLDATGLREAYRSSFMGTHYSVVVPLSPPHAGTVATGSTLVLRAVLRDAVTGLTVEGTRVVVVR